MCLLRSDFLNSSPDALLRRDVHHERDDRPAAVPEPLRGAVDPGALLQRLNAAAGNVHLGTVCCQGLRDDLYR